MSHVVNRVMSVVVDVTVHLGLGMDTGMSHMGVNPRDLSGRRETDGGREDPNLQMTPSVGPKDVFVPHG
jgi:hypothetical protein